MKKLFAIGLFMALGIGFLDIGTTTRSTINSASAAGASDTVTSTTLPPPAPVQKSASQPAPPPPEGVLTSCPRGINPSTKKCR